MKNLKAQVTSLLQRNVNVSTALGVNPTTSVVHTTAVSNTKPTHQYLQCSLIHLLS